MFSGSLFEGAPHPPSVLLKLIYHWSCQTNVQNVIQWVKVDNLYVKGFFTWLRAVCTVALHQHITLLGGHQKRIEVGVISLGTTSQGGQQKQVKVEVLGVLDPLRKIVRLRAVEPLTDGEKNYKKRFAKILEPLQGWVSKDSVILTDLTVDKGTLLTMGFKYINQAAGADGKYPNANIMEYLRTVVPRMFQNTLSLLSRQIIQQFLDELMWRECYGITPGKTFDNIIAHISEQTRLEAPETLVTRLNKVCMQFICQILVRKSAQCLISMYRLIHRWRPIHSETGRTCRWRLRPRRFGPISSPRVYCSRLSPAWTSYQSLPIPLRRIATVWSENEKNHVSICNHVPFTLWYEFHFVVLLNSILSFVVFHLNHALFYPFYPPISAYLCVIRKKKKEFYIWYSVTVYCRCIVDNRENTEIYIENERLFEDRHRPGARVTTFVIPIFCE